MWEARATYADGTEVLRYFDSNPNMSESDEQYAIEAWLIERHKGCTWYSVNWVNED